jgi:hypothetical protein
MSQHPLTQVIEQLIIETAQSRDLAKDVQANTINTLASAYKTISEIQTPEQQLQMKQQEHQLNMQQKQEEHQLKLQQQQQNLQFNQIQNQQKIQNQQELLNIKKAQQNNTEKNN